MVGRLKFGKIFSVKFWSVKFIIIFVLGISLLSCKKSPGERVDLPDTKVPGKTISLLCWNVQNLFDDVENGSEYKEFDPQNGNWNTRLFMKRLSGVQKVVEDITPGGPDILLLTEIENRNVIDVLNNDFLLACRYRYTYATAIKESPVQLAVLSRYPIISVGYLFPGDQAGRPLRPILEMRLLIKKRGNRLSDREVVIFLNHWKSRREGGAATERARLASAELLCERIRKLLEKNPSLLIIAAGDFNTSPGKLSHSEEVGKILFQKEAMLPFSPELSQNIDDSLFVSADKSLFDKNYFGKKFWDKSICGKNFCGLINNDIVLYSPWDCSGYPGSYFYRGNWEKIDNILLSPGFLDGEGWDLDKFICFSPEYLQTASGTPFRWNSRKGKGFSDHYPLFAEFVFFK